MGLDSAPIETEAVPVIDLAPTYEGSDDGRNATARLIRAACRDIGFFSVVNHGIDQSLIDQAFVEAQRFFALPALCKQAVAKRAGSNGYEALEGQVLDLDAPADFKESFNFTRPAEPGTPDDLENLWPADLPGFRENMVAYQVAAQGLGLHLSRLIALSLDMPLNFFDATFDNQKAALRLHRYPPAAQARKPNQLGAGAHTDFGWITILAQDGLGGLEIETASGRWVRVAPRPGALVINLGDLVTRWTNGLYHSSRHRVLNDNPVDRYSMVLFYNHRYETPVECLPTCLAPGETAKYPRAVSGEVRQARYEASRKHLGD